jgi:hypothetical protein
MKFLRIRDLQCSFAADVRCSLFPVQHLRSAVSKLPGFISFLCLLKMKLDLFLIGISLANENVLTSRRSGRGKARIPAFAQSDSRNFRTPGKNRLGIKGGQECPGSV